MELDVISFKKQLAPIRVKEDSTMDDGVYINTSRRSSLSSNSLVYASQLLAFYWYSTIVNYVVDHTIFSLHPA